MKKYLFTVLGTLVVLVSVMLADYNINKDFAVVQTMELKGETVNRYVSASGVIHEADKRDIYGKLPFKMEKVNVSVGDHVKVGQVLGYLDKNTFLNELNLSILQRGSGMTDSANAADLESMRQEIIQTDERVISPIDGVVTAVNCYESGRITTDLPIFTVSNLEEFYIQAKVPEHKAKEIFINQAVKVTAGGLHQQCDGMVESISPVVQTNQFVITDSLNLEVKIALKQVLKEMKPGMNTELQFLTTVRANAVIVPFDAVLEDEGGQYVYLNRSGYAKKQYVTLGEEFATKVEVLKGVSPADKLILEPRQNNMTHGQKIDEIPKEAGYAD